MYKDVVNKGAMYLDEINPVWYKEIDRDSLDVGSSCFCIGGQLYGNYSIFLRATRLKDGRLYGFTLAGTEDMDDFHIFTEYNKLTQAWLNAINERLEFDKIIADWNKQVDLVGV